MIRKILFACLAMALVLGLCVCATKKDQPAQPNPPPPPAAQAAPPYDCKKDCEYGFDACSEQCDRTSADNDEYDMCLYECDADLNGCDSACP